MFSSHIRIDPYRIFLIDFIEEWIFIIVVIQRSLFLSLIDQYTSIHGCLTQAKSFILNQSRIDVKRRFGSDELLQLQKSIGYLFFR